MKTEPTSFFTRIRQKLFDLRVNREIFEKIFSHLNKEKIYDYPFSTDDQMIKLTKELDVSQILDAIESQIARMPKSYGRAFRYVMRRELHAILKRYELIARTRMNPNQYDPRSVATAVNAF